MPNAWRVFGLLCLLAIPVEFITLWEANSGLLSKFMVLGLAVMCFLGGVQLLAFRLILDDQNISLVTWPGFKFVGYYKDIEDIRVRGTRSTLVIFRSFPASTGVNSSNVRRKVKIPASAIGPASLCEFLNSKIARR
jgi:hypothetical protein